MLSKLYPAYYYKNVFEIPLKQLKSQGVKGIAFDVDNTLSPHDCPEPAEDIIEFINTALAEGFSLCLLSNNSKKRIELYNKKLGIHSVYRANKPLLTGLRRAMNIMGTTAKSTALVGDQVFTDVLCGNAAGVLTILIMPCSQRDQWVTRIKRGLEKKVLEKYLKEREVK